MIAGCGGEIAFNVKAGETLNIQQYKSDPRIVSAHMPGMAGWLD
jgi:hypothetical protein